MRVPSFLLVAPLLVTASLTAQAKEAVDFEKQIWPIFEKRCIECHATLHTGPDGKTKKPKGGVTLDSRDGISTSKKGKVIVAKKPDDSLLYAAITLAADDEDRMPPPKKGEPLSAEQTALIKKWIEGGADFGKWTGKKADDKETKEKDKGSGKDEKGSDKPAPKAGDKPDKTVGKALDQLQKGVKALPAETLAPFASGPLRVASVGDDSPLLAVSCSSNVDSIDDQALAALAPLAEHIATLDLSRTKVGDTGCAAIARMKRLVTLDLRQTQVGDHGVKALAACTELRSLNLFGTKTGDYGLAALAALKHLEDLYVWQTDVSASAIVRLREGTPGLRIVMAPEMPEPMAEGTPGARRRR